MSDMDKIDLLGKIAAENRQLLADNARLRAAFHGICMFQNLDEDGKTMQDIARAALETPTASAAENTDDR